jgi:hypothetical protein
LAARGLVGLERNSPGKAAVRFEANESTRSEVDRIVAAEAECCPFLELTVRDSDVIELTITGPDAAAPVIDDLIAALSPATSP